MSAAALALIAGVAFAATLTVVAMRRRRARARLDRLSRHRRPEPSRPRTPLSGRFSAALAARPAAVAVAGSAIAGGLGLLLGGPVAAAIGAVYSAIAVIAGHRRVVRRDADRAVAALLDAIDDRIADLRAGVAIGRATVVSGASAVGGVSVGGPVGGPDRLDGSGRQVHAPAGVRVPAAARRGRAALSLAVTRLEAAQRISEALGTPLADLLDQVDTDLRAAQTMRLNLAAQTAGTQTTATLLLGLPFAGLWLGAGLGVDPVDMLLHTRLGAACALTGMALQCVGLLWTSRMIRAAAQEVR